MTLQERLREPKAWMAWNDYGTLTIAGDPIPAMDHDSQAPREAADALDAQAERIKALEGALRELISTWDYHDAEIEGDIYTDAFNRARATLVEK